MASVLLVALLAIVSSVALAHTEVVVTHHDPTSSRADAYGNVVTTYSDDKLFKAECANGLWDNIDYKAVIDTGNGDRTLMVRELDRRTFVRIPRHEFDTLLSCSNCGDDDALWPIDSLTCSHDATKDWTCYNIPSSVTSFDMGRNVFGSLVEVTYTASEEWLEVRDERVEKYNLCVVSRTHCPDCMCYHADVECALHTLLVPFRLILGALHGDMARFASPFQVYNAAYIEKMSSACDHYLEF